LDYWDWSDEGIEDTTLVRMEWTDGREGKYGVNISRKALG